MQLAFYVYWPFNIRYFWIYVRIFIAHFLSSQFQPWFITRKEIFTMNYLSFKMFSIFSLELLSCLSSHARIIMSKVVYFSPHSNLKNEQIFTLGFYRQHPEMEVLSVSRIKSNCKSFIHGIFNLKRQSNSKLRDNFHLLSMK